MESRVETSHLAAKPEMRMAWHTRPPRLIGNYNNLFLISSLYVSQSDTHVDMHISICFTV